MATVVCCRWLDAFPASYVTLLRNAVRANLARPHRFICVTDNPAALRGEVETAAMPDMGIPLEYRRRGCWPKLAIFAPDLLPPDEPTLYLDLDMLIRGSLDAFFERIERQRGFHVLREWNPTIWSLVPLDWRPDRGVQGSIIGFIPREQRSIYDRFMADPRAVYTSYHLDQDFLTDVAVPRTYWPHAWTVSFKWHCVRYWPLSAMFPRVAEPTRAKIVVFHGRPRPIDVVPLGDYRWGTRRKFGFGPVPWVRDYWLRHDESWVDAPAEAA